MTSRVLVRGKYSWHCERASEGPESSTRPHSEPHGQLGIPLPESSPTTSYRWEGQVPKGAWTLEVTLTDAGGKTAVVSTPLTMP